ncbi:protein lev-9-like isoform X1 [Orbicella faveolata]|uniref:protein lev-9-like isoform X1 n=1 Tax=Orbicella faveolata TaxID=48498 RepID=UPI0009E50EB4|nr:protein lev-9-like isoform X1 [Orbicella faveolata]
MKYAVVILAFFAVQGIRCQNCTRTNRQPKVCSKPCDPAQDDCKGNRDCVCDGDCGYSCVKRDLHCPRLTIDNGRVRYKNDTLGSVARYRCTSPYIAFGSKKRTCRGNGQWDGEKPTCKLICTDPGNIQHGKKSHDGFESGKKVKYSCFPGFTMEGSNTLTCTRTGVWDKVKPSCTCKRTNKQAFRYCRKSCNPDSGSCSKDKECVCDGDCGYSCLPKAIDCGKPTEIDNGRRQYSSTTFGSTVSYQCDKPYSLLGSKKRTCRGIRRWDGTEPSCKIICQDPGGVTNGNKQIFRRNLDEDYVAVGDRAEYNCFPGYKMEGSRYLTCTNSGEWNRAKPKCVLPSCGPPELPKNSELRGSKKSSYKYSEKVFLRCKSGYFSTGIGLLSCSLEGWTGPSFTCSPKSCGNPGIPENGKLKSYIFTFKSRVDFDCNHGYKLVGDKYRQCQANQSWTGRSPTCERKYIDDVTLQRSRSK